LAADPEFQRRFEREAMMAAALEHPHIIPVYDAGETDGVLYLAMRFVEGSDLATMIKANGRLDPRRTCAILCQVASALDAAHAGGLVHRDVKPGNILIDHIADAGRVEHVYLSDFGLTRRFAGTALSGTMLAGTPHYMAPERFRGVAAAPAIDVYALGCVAYACLIGSPPFTGDNIESVVARHLHEPPPRVSNHRADLPAGVDAILAKAIAKEPADRYPSCGAFADALHDEIHASAVASQTTWKPPEPAAGARANRWPRVPALVTRITGHRRIVGVAAVLVATLVALAVWWIAPGQPAATATRLIGTVNAFAIDPAGGVYLDTSGDSRILKVEPSGTIRTIAGTGTKGYSGDNGPATKAQLWNPQGLAVDGASNLYVADDGNHRVRKIDPAGKITTIAGNGTQDSTGDGGPAALAEFRYPVDVALDRSGNLYVAEGSGCRVRKIDLNGRISTVAGTGLAGFSGHAGPAQLPSRDNSR
jgi:serine/threonine protein kinase, bacterial